ncbi:MAG: tetratricopeptide repeat protein [Bacteroidales bacterium]|nr:tetratricopeptide repeat protein [Bacteroidales bacterium]
MLVFGTAGMSTPDSLRAVIKNEKTDDEMKAIASAELARHFLGINPDSAGFYADYGLNLSMKVNYLPGIFDLSCTLGKVNLQKDSIDAAITIFENAGKYIDKLENKRDALCVLLLLGYASDVKRDFYRAHEALYKGLRIAEETHDSTFLWSFFNNLGVHHIEIEDYTKSLELLRKGLSVYFRLHESRRKYSLASTYNNMAIAFINLTQPDSARVYLEKALAMPDIKGNFYGIHDIYGNLARISLMKDEPDRALEYALKAGSALDSLGGSFQGAMAPLYANQSIQLGEIYYIKGSPDQARPYLEKAILYADQASDLTVLARAYLYLAEIHEARGDFKESAIALKKHLEFLKSLNERKMDDRITTLTLKYQVDQELKANKVENELNELRNRRKELIYIFTIITAGGFLISLVLLFRLQRNKIRRKSLEEKTMQLENEKISEELEYKNKELTTNVIYLLKKNEFIASIAQRLNEVLGKLSEEDARILKGIIKELNNTVEDDTWVEFEVRFKEVHSNFYTRLSNQFPDLTAQELRLCAFLKLNMTNKEIAAITYQSTESLKTARYRLRKKLEIDRDENLVAFLTRI